MATEQVNQIGFYFKLSVEGVSSLADVSFKEASGFIMEMMTEEISEGGDNKFKHRVPTTVKFSNLVLKRGLVPKNSELISWCKSALEAELAEAIETKNIIVYLLDENGHTLNSWSFQNAWPVKWEETTLNSSANEILLESLEFSYSHFNVGKELN